MERPKWWLLLPVLVLHYLLLWAFSFPQPILITGTVLLCFLFPEHRKKWVIASTLLMGLIFSGNLYSLNSYIMVWSPFELSLNFRKYEGILPLPVVNTVSYLIYILFAGVISFAYRKLFRRFHLGGTIFIIGSVWIFLVLTSLLDPSNPAYFFLAVGTAILSKHVWYLFLLCRELPYEKGNPLYARAMNILPFWNVSTESRERLNLESYASSRQNLPENFRSGFHRLKGVTFWYFILMVIRIGGSTLLTHEFVGTDFGARFMPVVFDIYKNWSTQPQWKILLSIVLFGTSNLVEVFLVYGQMFVATAHFCGYRLTDYSDEPWKATSFANFIGRLMYYYNYIILTYFYYPLLRFTQNWKMPRNLRMAVCLPLSIFLGGYLFHFMRDTYRPLEKGFIEAHEFYFIHLVPYMAFLSLTLTVSVIFSSRTPAPPRLSAHQCLRIFGYVCIYSFGMLLNCAPFFGGLRMLPSVFKYLLGI